jgi:hypothetical protein
MPWSVDDDWENSFRQILAAAALIQVACNVVPTGEFRP